MSVRRSVGVLVALTGRNSTRTELRKGDRLLRGATMTAS